MARSESTTQCALDDCGRPARSRGYCMGHYGQLRAGRPLAPIQPRARGGGECEFTDCTRPRTGTGYCSGHNRQRKTGGTLKPMRKWKRQSKPCAFPECPNVSVAKGLCSAHHAQWRRGEDLRKFRSPQWRVNSSGYVEMISNKDGVHTRVLQHRQVMEEHLGRPLRPEETVHHRNGIRSQNNLENLELWASNHPPGQRIGEQIRWAMELLEVYGNDPLAYE